MILIASPKKVPMTATVNTVKSARCSGVMSDRTVTCPAREEGSMFAGRGLPSGPLTVLDVVRVGCWEAVRTLCPTKAVRNTTRRIAG